MGEGSNKCHKVNILKGRTFEIAKTFSAISRSFDWWHERWCHIFKPFCGGGLPEVNLSEQGNAGRNPSQTLRLFTASIYDVATMVMQQKEMYKFNRNLGKSSRRGPRQAAREAKDRAELIRIAENFATSLMMNKQF